jgi:uncharacterized protein (TIGR02246 family)
VDYARQTTPPLMTESVEALASALQSLLDQQAIRDLVAIYSVARDDNDMESLLDTFAPEGSFVIGGVPVTGHAALREFYAGNMDRYTTSLHTTHTHVIQPGAADQASGLVTGHAELSLGDTLMMAAYRYADRYAKLAGRWVFTERILRFMYAVPFGDMATSFTSAKRMRWPGTEPALADYPETLPTWTTYRG